MGGEYAGLTVQGPTTEGMVSDIKWILYGRRIAMWVASAVGPNRSPESDPQSYPHPDPHPERRADYNIYNY